MKPRRVVVTGLGALTPIGNTLSKYWEGLIAGTSGADKITYFDPKLFKTQFACELKGFDPLDFFDRKESREYVCLSHYALVAFAEAIETSGLLLEEV